MIEAISERMNNHAASGDPQVVSPSVFIPKAVALDAAPAKVDVVEAVRQLRNNKAARIDGMTAEVLKAGEDVLVNRLRSLLNLIWRGGKIPTEQVIVKAVLKNKL